jgi:hypothetical protein
MTVLPTCQRFMRTRPAGLLWSAPRCQESPGGQDPFDCLFLSMNARRDAETMPRGAS